MRTCVRNAWILMALMMPRGLPAADTRAFETIRNPLNRRVERELVRLRSPATTPPGSFTLRMANRAIPYQITPENGLMRIWVELTLDPGEAATLEIDPATPSPEFPPAVQVRETADHIELANELWALRLGRRAPLGSVRRAGGAWIGAPRSDPSTEGTVQVLSGPLFAEAVATYQYVEGGRRTLRVRMLRDQPYAIITEQHENAPGWAWDLVANWPAADRAVVRRWFRGPFQSAPPIETLDLDPASTRVPGAILHALPRWTQSYDEGWFIGASDGVTVVAAMPIRAGEWVWPHDNALVLKSDGPRQVWLQGPGTRGSRTWMLVVGDITLADQALELAGREAFAPLDKLHNRYILDPFPGIEPHLVRPANFYSPQTNPTDVIRRWSREELRRVDEPSQSMQDLYEAQAYLDPDWFGCYENFWSPINPNFYTDFIQLGILKTIRLRNHPRFEELRTRALRALRSDLRHSVTLPGGAGQECPGYQLHAARQWARLAPAVAQHLGFDLRADPRWRAVGYFLAHSSVPAGPNRRLLHPAGDTHPGLPDPLQVAAEFDYRAHPREWRSEELPGFGVIFRHRSGEPDETFLSFKSGPNRGHYHGDSLSFHLCFQARDVAPDHRVSYLERPGQEHMHNRLAFSSGRFKFANMDGYERLIAFRTFDRVDVAAGQVESPRLREVQPLPPEEWDQRYRVQELRSPLIYRRTVVFMRRGDKLPCDLFVIRDQFWSAPDDDIRAAYFLHVKDREPEIRSPRVRWSILNLHAGPEITGIQPFSWTPQRRDLQGEATNGVRIEIPTVDGCGELITLLWPGNVPLPVEIGREEIRIGDLVVTFRGTRPADPVHVRVEGAAGPWLELGPEDSDFNRWQGDIGLFVPTAGYPFGPLPEWLIRQRAKISRETDP